MNHNEHLRHQALALAQANKLAEPGIMTIYWFPADNEIRLLELEPGLPSNGSDQIEPFYFSPSAVDKLDYPSAIALIRPEEANILRLPEGWGEWQDAQSLPI